MTFCPNCDSLFNITKDVNTNEKKKQVGGAKKNKKKVAVNTTNNDHWITRVVKKALSKKLKEKHIPTHLTNGMVITNETFMELSEKNKGKVLDRIQLVLKDYQKQNFNVNRTVKEDDNDEKKAYFQCNNCKNYAPIKNGTVIFSQTLDQNKTLTAVDNSFDIKLLARHRALLHMKTYDCPNLKCITHKDPTKKNCVKLRLDSNKYNTIFYCLACESNWPASSS